MTVVPEYDSTVYRAGIRPWPSVYPSELPGMVSYQKRSYMWLLWCYNSLKLSSMLSAMKRDTVSQCIIVLLTHHNLFQSLFNVHGGNSGNLTFYCMNSDLFDLEKLFQTLRGQWRLYKTLQPIDCAAAPCLWYSLQICTTLTHHSWYLLHYHLIIIHLVSHWAFNSLFSY